MAVTPSLSRAEESNPYLVFGVLGIARPWIVFVLRRGVRRDDCSSRGNGCQVSEIYDTNRHCFLPGHFDFLLTKCRKARRRMRAQGYFAARNGIAPAISYN
jgi:hypothetical protein